jgi:hypothetical protein
MTGGERRLFKDHTTDVTKIIRSLFFIHVVACFGRERPSAGSTTAGCSEGESGRVCVTSLPICPSVDSQNLRSGAEAAPA